MKMFFTQNRVNFIENYTRSMYLMFFFFFLNKKTYNYRVDSSEINEHKMKMTSSAFQFFPFLCNNKYTCTEIVSRIWSIRIFCNQMCREAAQNMWLYRITWMGFRCIWVKKVDFVILDSTSKSQENSIHGIR